MMGSHFWQGTWRGSAPAGEEHVRSREIVRHTGGIVRGKFPSRKNGRMVQHEGLLELDAIYLFEASPLIAGFREQPAAIRFADGTKLRKYTPDFEVTLMSGENVLVEVKPKAKLADPELDRKLKLLEDYFARRDQVFVVLTEEQLRLEPRQSNLRWVFHQAPRIYPQPLAIQVAVSSAAGAFPMSIRRATEVLGSAGVDPFSALLVGCLVCDLDRSVSLETLVQPPLEICHDWFRIAQTAEF
jgi:hypothetical protein